MEDGDGGAESVPDLSHRCAVLASQRFIPLRSKWESLSVPRHDERRRYLYDQRGGGRSVAAGRR